MADELTRKAIEEIVRELGDGKCQNQVVERKLNPLGKANKRFLGRTISSVINHNNREDRRTRENCRQKLRQLEDRRTKRLRQEFRRRRSKSERSRSESSHEIYSSSEDSRRGKRKKKKKKLSKYKRGNGSSSDSSHCSSRKEGNRRNSEHGDEGEQEELPGPIPAMSLAPINQWLMLNQAYLAGAASAQAANSSCENVGSATLNIRLSSDENVSEELMDDLRVTDTDSSDESIIVQEQMVDCISLLSSDEDSNLNILTVPRKEKSNNSEQVAVAACITLDSDTESDESKESEKSGGQKENALANNKGYPVSTFVDLDTDSESEDDEQQTNSKADDQQKRVCITLDSDSDSGCSANYEGKTDNSIMLLSDTDSEDSEESEESVADKTIEKPEEITDCIPNENPEHLNALANEEPVEKIARSDVDAGCTQADNAEKEPAQDACVRKDTELECSAPKKDDADVQEKQIENLPPDTKEMPLERIFTNASGCTEADNAEKEPAQDACISKDTELECNAPKKDDADVQENQIVENLLPDTKEMPLEAIFTMDANAADQELKEQKSTTSSTKDDDVLTCSENEPAVVNKNIVEEKPTQMLEKRKTGTENKNEPPKKSLKLDADNDYIGLQGILNADQKEEKEDGKYLSANYEGRTENSVMISDTESEDSEEREESVAEKTIDKPEEITNCIPNENPEHLNALVNEEPVQEIAKLDDVSGCTQADNVEKEPAQDACIPKDTELECNAPKKDDADVHENHIVENLMPGMTETPLEEIFTMSANAADQELKEQESVTSRPKYDAVLTCSEDEPAVINKNIVEDKPTQILEKRKTGSENKSEPAKKSFKLDADDDYIGLQEILNADQKEKDENYRVSEVLGIESGTKRRDCRKENTSDRM